MKVTAENITMRFFRKTGQANYFAALNQVTLTLAPGAVTVLMGRSGSGKTTLLHILAGLLPPTEGTVTLDGQNLYALADGPLSRLRSLQIAVVPQGRSLLDTLTVRENLLLPAMLCKQVPDIQAAEQASEDLEISGLMDAYPAELSGGELRRAAIARALIQPGKLLLADEPTGDLDDHNTQNVLNLFRAAAHRDGKTVLLVTHENEALAYADRAFRLDAGKLSEYSGNHENGRRI